LQVDDINHLYNRGTNKNKFKNAYFNYYIIDKDCVIEKHLSYPWLTKTGCKSYTKAIKFVIINSKIHEEAKTIEENSKEVQDKTKVNQLDNSILIPSIFSNACADYNKSIFSRFKKVYISRRRLTIIAV
jgi:hypothetical protein